MVSNKKGQGFQSAAGLIRYFDEEDDRAPKIPPWFVVALCIGSAIVVTIAAWMWPVA
jgi:preprotein translocase subunit Sec61beta